MSVIRSGCGGRRGVAAAVVRRVLYFDRVYLRLHVATEVMQYGRCGTNRCITDYTALSGGYIFKQTNSSVGPPLCDDAFCPHIHSLSLFSLTPLVTYIFSPRQAHVSSYLSQLLLLLWNFAENSTPSRYSYVLVVFLKNKIN